MASEGMASEGLASRQSRHGPQETMSRLEAAVTAEGMTVFAHVDHAAGAAAAGLTLRPTDLLIFGNARGGTPLMQAVQTIGLDLPLRILVWQDAAGQTWLAWNDPLWLAHRHGLGLLFVFESRHVWRGWRRGRAQDIFQHELPSQHGRGASRIRGDS